MGATAATGTRTGRRATSPEIHEQRRAFGTALSVAMKATSLSQTELAALLGESQSTVSAWLTGMRQPSVEMVWRIEETLSLAPGVLSQHLGYMPVSATTLVNLDQAIDLEPGLTEMERDLLRLQLKTFRS